MASNARNLANLLGAGEATISAEKLGNDVPPGTEDYSSVDSLGVGTTIGETAFVEATNRLYIWNGSGWYNIALINTTPTWDSGGQPAGAYVLDGDSPQDATVITLAASDPEGLPISYDYITSGSMDSIATISQDSSVFTITPKTSVQAPNGGTGSITFRATDGVNILPQVSSFTLTFISIIENSKYTTLLTKAVDTSDNNNITDSSTNNHSITASGDTHAGTFSPYRSGGYSLGFSGNSYITLSNSSTFELTDDFCIDGFWYLPTTNSGTIFELGQYQNGILLSPDQYDNGIYVNGTKLTGLASSVTINTWQHFAIVRKGSGSNNLKLYIDGTKVAESTVTANINSNYSSYINIRIGSATHSSGSFDLDDGSHIRDLRIVKGDSVYPSSGDSVPPNSITVPTEKSTAITGTILLAGTLPYLADASTTDSTFTVTNAVSTKPFSPYDYNEYAATDHGGSVYFDGNGDALQIANTISLSGDFTVSAWVYLQGSDKSIIFGSSYPPNFQFSINTSNQIGFYEGSTETGTGVIQRDVWNYCVWTRSGSTVSMYVNGESHGSANSTSTFQIKFVGSLGGIHDVHNGYISDAQVKTTSTSAANAVPPIASLSSSGAELHIKGTDASIIDKSQGSNLKLVGGTAGSTTQVKFADTKSMYFDGVGYYLETSSTSFNNFNFGTGDFTVELFLRNVNQLGYSYYDILGTANNGGYIGSNRGGWMLSYYTSQFLKFNYQYNNTWVFENSFAQTLNINTWYHIAVTRQGTQLKCFVDGNQAGSTITNSTNLISTEPLNIGRGYGGGVGTNSYIQDVRITKGLARYTSNFTPLAEPPEG